MAAITTIVAVAALAVAAASAYSANQQRKDAAGARDKSEAEAEAQKAQEQAQARRAAVREERVRRARIIQSGENTGTSGSSGEVGAIGGMSTQLSSNIGFNLGTVMRSRNMGEFNQSAFNSEQKAQRSDQIGGMAMSIFGASGGFSNFGSTTSAAPSNSEPARYGY